MALSHLFQWDHDQPVLFEEYAGARKVILNRPNKLNSLTYKMVCAMTKSLETYEKSSDVNLVILKGNGKAFCAGGDSVGLFVTMAIGHWSFGAKFYERQLLLDYLLATYKKPLVCLLNGIVMGGGAGLSMHAMFIVVTEKTVFAMPEASIGLIPDVGASYFLSRLPGFFGEYVGLTGVRLSGAEMLECGLATHFVLSKDLPELEHALCEIKSSSRSEISKLIDKYAIHKPDIDNNSPWKRLDIINKCFSRDSVEEILHSLEELRVQGNEKWIIEAVNYINSASPTSLKIFLRSIREGREQTLEQCLVREYTISCNIAQRKISSDCYEGSRAMLIEKDKKPKWQPAKLELVMEEYVDRFFKPIEDDEPWICLQLPTRSNLILHSQRRSKL